MSGARLLLVLAPFAAALFEGVASAQEEERERVLCDPATQCAGELCACLEDSLEVTFDGNERSVVSVGPPDVGATVKATIVLRTRRCHRCHPERPSRGSPKAARLCGCSGRR